MSRYGDGTNAAPWWSRLIAIFVIGTAMFVAGVLLAWQMAPRQGDWRPSPESLLPQNDCARPVTLVIAAAPSIASLLADVANEAGRVSCTELQVRPEEPAETVRAFIEGRGPDLWVPDSSTWAGQVHQTHAGLLTSGRSLATSPLVVAAGRDRSVSTTSWSDLFTGESPAVVADVALNAPSRLALAVVATELGEDRQARSAMNVVMVQARSDSVRSTAERLAGLENPDAAPFPVDEATLSSFLAAHPTVGAQTVIPEQGTIRLDYPLFARANEPGRVAQASTALREAMSGPGARDALHAAGFRASPNDSTAPAYSTLTGTPRYVAPTPEVIDRVRTLWTRAGTPGRQLVAIDVDKGMAASAGGRGGSRAEVASQGLINALETSPESSEMGLWAFSEDPESAARPHHDHEELLPVLGMNRTLDSHSQRASLSRAFASLPDMSGGNSSLYETVWAGYERALSTWQDGRTNALIIVTDGPVPAEEGMELQELLGRLERARDPQRPVSVSLVEVSGADNTDALRQIAEVTGGRAYTASEPEDFRGVFADVLVHRQLSRR